MKIAVNEALGYLRAAKKEAALNKSIQNDINKPNDCLAEKVVLRSELDRCIKEIPINHQIILLMKHGLELTYPEMSFVLGETVGTVKGTLFRSRQLLKNALLKYESEK